MDAAMTRCFMGCKVVLLLFLLFTGDHHRPAFRHHRHRHV
jgi:hypothetical protein